MEYFWQIIRGVYSHWGSGFDGRYHKVIAYVIIIILIFFSILDRTVDWQNYTELCDLDSRFSLGAGPVRNSAKEGLLTFAIIGIFCCVFEIGNTVTLICFGGHVIIPVEIEQGVILLVEQIPQAIINLAVTICRNNFVTSLQAWQCFWGLANTSLRLYGYGYLKERIYKINRGGVATTTRVAIYITTTFLWLFLAFDNGFLWHHARLGHMQFKTKSGIEQLDGVSITLVRVATHTRHPINASLAYEMIREERTDPATPWLVKNVADIAMLNGESHTAVYKCRKRLAFFEPEPCANRSVEAISFQFRHVVNKQKLEVQPIGEIQYGYGLIQSSINESCTEQKEDLFADWRLEFYRFLLIPVQYTREKRREAKRAWENVCIIPRLRFNTSIPGC